MAYQITQRANSKLIERTVVIVLPEIPDNTVPPPSEGWIYPRGVPAADEV